MMDCINLLMFHFLTHSQQLSISYQEELEAYADENGDCNVPKEYAANPQLGSWVDNQRTCYKNGELSDDRIERLEDLGFSWDPNQDSWDRCFKELAAYKLENGDCNVPKRFEGGLGAWVVNQRSRKDSLSDDRKKRLEDLGFQWKPKRGRKPKATSKSRASKSQNKWDVRFEELAAYKLENGDCNVPQKYPANPQLGKWVTHQRERKGSLSDDRKKRLEDLGFAWSLRSKKRKSEAPSDVRTYHMKDGKKSLATNEFVEHLLESASPEEREELESKVTVRKLRKICTRHSIPFQNERYNEIEKHLSKVLKKEAGKFFTLARLLTPSG